MNSLAIDCFGHPCNTSLSVECDGVPIEFAFEEKTKKRHRSFHAAVFLDYAAAAHPSLWRYPRSRRFAMLCEPGSSRPFLANPHLARHYRVVMTQDARLLDCGAPYVEFLFGTSWIDHIIDRPTPFSKSRIVSLMGAKHNDPKGMHVLRNNVIDTLRQDPRVDCFGRGVNPVDSKLTALEPYAFSIAIENSQQNFYFSEKIIDCFLTDTVPIYLGCPKIERFFDARGMITFNSHEELPAILDSLSLEKYEEMFPYVQANRERAIQHNWHSRHGLYVRAADIIRSHLTTTRPVRLRPQVVRACEAAWRAGSRLMGRTATAN